MARNYLFLGPRQLRLILKFTHLSLIAFASLFRTLLPGSTTGQCCCLQPLNIGTDAIFQNNKRFFALLRPAKSRKPSSLHVRVKTTETWTCTVFITSFSERYSPLKMLLKCVDYSAAKIKGRQIIVSWKEFTLRYFPSFSSRRCFSGRKRPRGPIESREHH